AAYPTPFSNVLHAGACSLDHLLSRTRKAIDVAITESDRQVVAEAGELEGEQLAEATLSGKDQLLTVFHGVMVSVSGCWVVGSSNVVESFEGVKVVLEKNGLDGRNGLNGRDEKQRGLPLRAGLVYSVHHVHLVHLVHK